MLDKLVVVFDLDDTLYKEIEFLKSAYVEIAKVLTESVKIKVSSKEFFHKMIQYYFEDKNVFSEILNEYQVTAITIKDLLGIYRNHQPSIKLSSETKDMLVFLKENNSIIGIITDGRSIQQRSKIKALGLKTYMDFIVVSEEIGSEKPSLKNYQIFEDKFAEKESKFLYIGDNLKKDFVTPNKLGWDSIFLRDKKGLNVHSQDVLVADEFLPKYEIDTIGELKDLILNIYA
ncbi:MAG: HAD-IA family hydrolase [Polaribacter sp.]|jgi:putative hydrolase of the HAD superfamily|nr:HAD-IA family hydrolase [Polaribacter sp.]